MNIGKDSFFIPALLIFRRGRPKKAELVEPWHQEVFTFTRPTPEVKKDNKSQEKTGGRGKEEQKFKLGEHEVIAQDKVGGKFVHKMTGSVDFHEFDEKRKRKAEFYDNISAAAVILGPLYSNSPQLFEKGAVAFIEENLELVEIIKRGGGRDKAGLEALAKEYGRNRIYGPEGVLNLLLAFNRVRSKLGRGAVVQMISAARDGSTPLIIDLRKRKERSVTVELYDPEITTPDIGKLPTGSPDTGMYLTVEKTMRTSGSYTVEWSSIRGELNDPLFKTVYVLRINPNTDNIKIGVLVWVKKTGKSTSLTAPDMTITEFDKRLKQNPHFLTRLDYK